MTLTLTVLRCPDRIAPETRRIEGGELIIGRGPGAAWTLSDTSDKPQISRRHCTVFYAGGGWKITDQSTNGTYLNREADPIGAGERALRDGDRLRVGPYEIELAITEDRDQRGTEIGGGVAFDPFAGSAPFAQSTPFSGNSPYGHGEPQVQGGGAFGASSPSPFGSSAFGPDPFAGGREASPFGGESAFGGGPGEPPFGAPQSVRLPDDFASELFGSSEPPKPPPAQMDHTPAFMDVMNLPQTRSVLPTNWDDPGTPATPPVTPATAPFSAPFGQPPVPAPSGGPPPAAPAIPANWDDLDPIIPTAPVAPTAPAPAPAAIPARWDEPTAPTPPAPSPFASPFEPAPPAAPAVAPNFSPEAEIPVAAADRTGISRGLPPEQTPPPAAPIREAPPAPFRETAAGDAALLAAFLRGAGMVGADLSDPTAAMERAGAAFRAFVAGLREVLIARAEVKSAFRIDQTIVRARGNNPLKFAAGDDDALAALLGAGRRTEMTPAAAVGEALRDIRLHELATMSAMQEAVRELLAKIEPGKLRTSADSGGIGLPMQRKAKAWELYETEFARLSESLSERFDDAFGRSFARAYEQVMAELQSKGSLR